MLLVFLILLTLLIGNFGGQMNWKQVAYIVILAVAIVYTFFGPITLR